MHIIKYFENVIFFFFTFVVIHMMVLNKSVSPRQHTNTRDTSVYVHNTTLAFDVLPCELMKNKTPAGDLQLHVFRF